MQQIINFLIKIRNTLWFLFLLAIAITFTVQTHTYHSNKVINSTNILSGSAFEFQNNISDYFNLKDYNERLLKENTLLKKKLQQLLTSSIDSSSSSTIDSAYVDSLKSKFQFKYARVINSTYHKKKNYLTLNKGELDGIEADMGVITDLGIVGIVKKVSNKYANVISILNEDSRINAQLKNTNHFGSLTWEGENPNVVQLTDIPKLAPIKEGDTIITGGRSTIFPKGINIGAVKDFVLGSNQNYYTVNVNLFNDMTDVGFVQLIKNEEAEEIKELESASNE